jgi:hypothetical protein
MAVRPEPDCRAFSGAPSLAGMKTRFLPAVLAGVAVLIFADRADAARRMKSDFTQFHGVFSGTTTLALSSGGSTTTYSGNAKIAFRAPARGDSGLMRFFGTVSGSGTSYPFSGLVLFALNHAALEDVLFKAAGSAGGVLGSYKLSRRRLIFDAQGTLSGTDLTVHSTLRTVGNKHVQKLILDYVLSSPTTTYTWHGVFRRRLK